MVNKVMGWFTRKPDPMTAHTRELNAEIAALEVQIHQLNDATNYSNPLEIQTVLDEARFFSPDSLLKAGKELTEPIPAKSDRDCSNLYNDQDLRKFDLVGWWLRVKRLMPLPAPTKNEKLVTYLATGRNHGHTTLRKETRVARNRFILLTLVLLAALWSILSLLIPQLQ